MQSLSSPRRQLSSSSDIAVLRRPTNYYKKPEIFQRGTLFFFYTALSLISTAFVDMKSVRGFVSQTHTLRGKSPSRQLLTTRSRAPYLLSSSLHSVSPDASSEAINDTKQKKQQQQQQQHFTTAPTVVPPAKNAPPWDTLCDMQLPEGRCVGLTLRELDPKHPDAVHPEAISNNSSHWIHSRLDPLEISYGIALPSDVRRETFFIGRLAVREALGLPPIDSGDEDDDTSGIPPILRDEHGRPIMPKGYLGSISHKDRSGVGLVTMDETFSSPDDNPKIGIGVDLERTANNRRSVAKKILTPNELTSLGRLPGISANEEVLLRFSLKESIYKAVHPLLCQYIGFQEAEVTPHPDGTATVTWDLKSGAHIGLENVTAHWQKLPCGEYFLSSSTAYLKDDGTSERDGNLSGGE